MKPLRGLRLQLQKGAARFVFTTFLRPPLLDDWNPRSRGQFVHRLWEIEVFVIHDKPENAPADAAAKTMERLPLRTDRERRSLFLMKWTKGLEVRTGTLERKIAANHFYDIVRGCDLFDCFRRNCHLFTRSDFAAVANLARDPPLPKPRKNRPRAWIRGRAR